MRKSEPASAGSSRDKPTGRHRKPPAEEIEATKRVDNAEYFATGWASKYRGTK